MPGKIIFLLSLFFALQLSGKAQALTGKVDTSFSIYTEYNKLKKDYPFIQPVLYSPSKTVAEKRDIPYCITGPRKLLLDAFIPVKKTGKKKTAIVIIHGGGWRSGNKAQHHALAIKLAEKGYACFTPEYRLSTEALYPAAVIDLKSAIRWVHANAAAYGIDTNKIVVAGFSAGGQLAAFLGSTIYSNNFPSNNCNQNASEKLSAVVDMDGILAFIHPESGEGDDSKRTSAATSWFGVSKNDRPDLWRRASALTYVGHQTPPTLFINSGVPRMHAGRDDYRKILDAFGIYSEQKTFEGAPHSFPLFQPWFDSTVGLVDNYLNKVFESKKPMASTIIVAQDGTGHYKTVQAAFDAIPPNSDKPFIIFVKNGSYHEKLFLDSTKRFITLIGEDKFKTIFSYNDHSGKISPKGDTVNTYTSQTFLAAASDFTARNISFENAAGFAAGQAVAIQILGDRTKFIDCRFIGNQDVLFPSRAYTRQYFEHCYIEGTTDFIFGPSVAWFEGCHIHSKKNSHVTAASTPNGAAFGYVFNDCVFTGDTSLHNVSLGRPWRPFAQVVVMNSYIGQHIKPEGWSNWNNTENYLTTKFAEFKNYGPSATPLLRVKWATELTDREAKQYVLQNVFGNWQPRKQ